MLTKFKKYWEKIGPGIVTGAADDDPSGVATYSQVGAKYGFQFLWTAVFTFPFMAIVQEMCTRIGLVTGKGLANAIRNYCPPYVLYTTTLLLFVANTFNIGADLSAVGETTRLLIPSLSAGEIIVIFTAITLLLQVLVPYKEYARYIKYLSFTLVVYIIAGLNLDIDWINVFHQTLIPHITFSKDFIILIGAVLGTSISPYLFFWQPSQQIEEEREKGRELELNNNLSAQVVEKNEAIADMRFDVWTGMFFSNLVMFFIILVCGAVLFPNGITNIGTAKDAAQALLPIAGKSTYLLFTLGILGTGLLGVPVLAGSSAYAIAETFRFKEGLYNKYREAQAFYLVIIISVLIGVLISFSGVHPMQVLIYSAVFNGIIAPILLVVIVYLAGREKIMGQWKNTKLQSFLGWFITAIMSIVGLTTIWFLL